MVIILEGPDGSGKTTLAKQLQDRYGLEYHHEGPPPKNIKALDHYGAVLDNLRQENVVVDRFALGELVYGPILRGSDTLGGLEGWRVFDRLASACNAVHILCLPAYHTSYMNWVNRRGQELFNDQTQYKMTYEAYLLWQGTQDIIYDYERMTFGEVCEEIDLRTTCDLRLPSPYVGEPRARYLLVGERGADPNCKHNLPFFSTVNSSHYLYVALMRAGFAEDEIALVNAFNHDGSSNELLQFQVTIPLGKVAMRAVLDARDARRIDTAIFEMPHPQYWKRFHASEYDKYVELLTQCRL